MATVQITNKQFSGLCAGSASAVSKCPLSNTSASFSGADLLHEAGEFVSHQADSLGGAAKVLLTKSTESAARYGERYFSVGEIDTIERLDEVGTVATGVITVAEVGVHLYDAAKDVGNREKFAGDMNGATKAFFVAGAATAGAIGGGVVGAAIGTFIGGPVVGTAIGAAVGSAMGGVAGGFLGSWFYDKALSSNVTRSYQGTYNIFSGIFGSKK